MKPFILKFVIFLLIKIAMYVYPHNVFAENILNASGGVGLNTYQYGIRFLMYVSKMHAWGPEITYLEINREKYLSVCVVLEARLFNILINQMGLAGYIGDKNAKPFGIRLSTGLDVLQTKNFSFPLGLRIDIIFDESIIHSNNVELGIRVKF